MKESDIVIDIERCVDKIKEASASDVSADNIFIPISVDELGKGEKSSSPSSINEKNVGGVCQGSCKNSTKKEKRLTMSAKKPPKPPRPPRGLSLDAADQKLIKQLSELAMIKRARIERMKALKKMKAAKASSSSSVSTSSGGNLIAMLFTVLFCVVVIFQGCHPSGFSPRNSSGNSNGAIEGNIFVLYNQQNLSTTGRAVPTVGSPNIVQPVRASDNTDVGRKANN